MWISVEGENAMCVFEREREREREREKERENGYVVTHQQ